MEKGKKDIVLGGTTYSISVPFTLGQLRVFQPAFVRFGGMFDTEAKYDALFTAMVVALARDYPAVDKNMILALEMTPIELRDASDQMALASGLFTQKQFDDISKKKDASSGEATASIGASSTAS